MSEIKKILCYAIESDKSFEKHTGTWFDLSDINFIVSEDSDVYGCDTDGSIRLLARFRKNVFSSDMTDNALKNLRKTAVETKSRAAAAGPIDPTAFNKRIELIDISGHRATFKKADGSESVMRVNNPVASGTLGYFEKTKHLSLPCRLTTLTRENLKQFKSVLPFIHEIDKMFKTLIPDAHALQYEAAHKMPDFVIGDTAFSTITTNWNFRTALHKDSGDFENGFGNLTVVERGKYRGGVTMFPRFRIGFDVRTGDFLAMNVHEFHTNSPIYTTPEDDEYNLTLPELPMTWNNRNTVGGMERYGRLAIVCYLREKIKDCDIEQTKTYYKKINYVDE